MRRLSDEPMRLLVLEDDPLIAAEIAYLASLCDWDVETCVSSADEAIEIGLAKAPDLLIADLDLGGGKDGCEAAIALHETIGLKTVFVTGQFDARSRDRTQQAWPLGFLRKPFTPEAFCGLLRSAGGLLDYKRSMPQLFSQSSATYSHRSASNSLRKLVDHSASNAT